MSPSVGLRRRLDSLERYVDMMVLDLLIEDRLTAAFEQCPANGTTVILFVREHHVFENCTWVR